MRNVCQGHSEVNSSREPGIAGRTETWRDSLPIDMLLSAVSVLVVAQSSSETPKGLMNNPVYIHTFVTTFIAKLQFKKKIVCIFLPTV